MNTKILQTSSNFHTFLFSLLSPFVAAAVTLTSFSCSSRSSWASSLREKRWILVSVSGEKKNRAWLLSISRLYTWVEIPFWREEVVSSLMLVPPRLVCVRVIVASGWSRDVWTAARPRLVLLCWVPHAYCCWKSSACSSSFGLRVDSSIFLVISLSLWFSSSDFRFSFRSSFSTLHKFSFTLCLFT